MTADPIETTEQRLLPDVGLIPRPGWLTAGGFRMRIHEWGTPGTPGVVLVHGGAAHSHWWDHIAPWLAVTRHVIALDLSGHGDSDRRPDGYTVELWASEVLAAAERVSQAGRPVLIGHSMGGMVCLRAGAHPDVDLAGVVTLDAALRPIGATDSIRRQLRVERVSLFPTKSAAVERFRTLPQGGSHRHVPSVVRHIADNSVHETSQGWTWKLDRKIWLRPSFALDDLRPLDCPALVVAAEHGMLTAERATQIARRLGPTAATLTLPLAGHHVMLDEPVAVATCLATALASWQGSPSLQDEPDLLSTSTLAGPECLR